MNKLKRKEGKFFFIEDQVIYVEEMMMLENHHSATITVITESAKNHQCLLKLMGRKLMRNWIFP